jgi:hypothetical protein
MPGINFIGGVMKKVKSRWIRFFSPGSFVSNETDVVVNDIFTQPDDIEFPENAYCFMVFEREDVVDGDKTFNGKPKKVGKTYYHPDSFVRNAEQIENMDGDWKILLSNMRCNDWKYVVFTRWGNYPQKYNDNDDEIIGG